MHFETLSQADRDSILKIKGKAPATEEIHDAVTPEPSSRAPSVLESATKQEKKAEKGDAEVRYVLPFDSHQFISEPLIAYDNTEDEAA